MSTESAALDSSRTEAFASRMTQVVNDACLGFLVSIGHETGLFDRMAALPASTSAEIAAAAGLDERYVREWLAGVTLGGIVEYEPRSRAYRLPPEHAPFLTRAGGPDNIAVFTQYLPLLGIMQGRVMDAFRDGGGVAASEYPRFQDIQAMESGPIFEANLVSTTLPLVPGLVDRLREGIDVLDIGCGQGRAVNVLAREFPASRFSGYDISPEAVAAARAEAEAWRLPNARFEMVDIAASAPRAGFDLITAFDVIHDLARPRPVLRAIHQALRDDGVLLMVEFTGSSNLEDNHDLALGPTLAAFSVFYCMPTSLADGGEGLGTLWGEQKAREYLADAGFHRVEVHHPAGDEIHAYFVCQK